MEGAEGVVSAVDSGSGSDDGKRDVLWKAGSKEGDDDGVGEVCDDLAFSALSSFMVARNSLSSASAISSRLIGRRLFVDNGALSSAFLGGWEVCVFASF